MASERTLKRRRQRKRAKELARRRAERRQGGGGSLDALTQILLACYLPAIRRELENNSTLYEKFRKG